MTSVDAQQTSQSPSGGSDPTPAATLGRADQLVPVILIGSVGVGLGLAKTVPRVASALAPAVSVGVIALIFMVMLAVDLRGVGRAFGQRKFLIVAVTINFVLNPVIAWVLGAIFLNDQPELWVGLILFLVTPCIGWYLIFTELASGDTVLGVSLLAINIALQLLLLPLYLWLFAGRVLTVDLATIAVSVGTYLVIPFVAATIVRQLASRHQPSATLQANSGLAHAKTVALVVVIVAMFASQGDVLFENPGVVWKVGPPIVVFFAIAFVVGVVGARVAGLPYDQAALLVFTTTSRNSEASLAIAVTAFSSPLVALTVVIGPVIELPLLALMARALLAIRPKYRRSLPNTAQ